MKKFFTCFWSILLMLMLSSGLNAASITYSLTTHVDGRTITGTASLNAGANLQNSMPQALWRADCEYTYYSDAAMTQPITVAPAENAKVYVDYVFHPDFAISTPDNIQYYFVNSYIGGTRRLMYTRPRTSNESGNALIGATSANQTVSNPKSYYAFFGDAYCLKIMTKPGGSIIARWLTDTNSSNPYGAVIASPDESQAAEWQYYESLYDVGGRGVSTRVFATADTKMLYFSTDITTPDGVDTGNVSVLNGFRVSSTYDNVGDVYWDSKHRLTGSQGAGTAAISNASFFMTFSKSSYVTTYLNYRILKANGTWNPDIVLSAESKTGKAIAWPSDYSQKSYCKYEYYYQDGDFLVKYPDDYLVPTDTSIVIYIKETYKRSEPFQKDKWITMVVPYAINNFDEWFGATDPVKVLELYDYELNGNKYDLKFRYTTKMEASKPYLFKAVNVPDLGEMCLAMTDQDVQETWIKETIVEGLGKGGADVTMRGTYKGVTLKNEDQSANKLFAFLAYNSAGDINFYRINEKRSSFNITPYRCYFTFTDPTGAGTLSVLNMSIKEDMVDAIGEVIATAEVEPLTGTYDLMGRKVDASNMRRGIYVVNGRKVVK